MNTCADISPEPLAHQDAKAQSWRDGWRLVVWCLVCLGIPLLVLRGVPPDDDAPGGEQRVVVPRTGKRSTGAETEDVKRTIAELQSVRPECIGIGNSMMFTRLGKSPEAMSGLTGRKHFFLYKNGSDVRVWYLTLKNIVRASGVRLRSILLFVRDDELTRVFRSKGVESPYLKSLRGEHEPELDRFIQEARSDGRVDHWLGELYTFPDQQERMSRRLMDVAMDLGGIGATKKAQRFVLSSRFSLEHLRGDVPADTLVADELQLMTSGFRGTIEASLLPDMVRMAKECGARLVVFRVKRRPDARTHLPEEPEGMRDYVAFLDGWLKEQGCGFFDETYDTSIQLTDYLDGDHIRPERLDWYRGYFLKRMEGIYP